MQNITQAADLQIKINQLKQLASELGISDQVSIEPKRITTRDLKESFTLICQSGKRINFKSWDSKSAKYRAYRLLRDEHAGEVKKSLIDSNGNEIN